MTYSERLQDLGQITNSLDHSSVTTHKKTLQKHGLTTRNVFLTKRTEGRAKGKTKFKEKKGDLMHIPKQPPFPSIDMNPTCRSRREADQGNRL